MAAARPFLITSMPRLRNTSSSTSARSGSSLGRIWSRADTSVTREPQREKKSANSQPVGPAPSTTRCSGHLRRSNTWRVVSTRWPSGRANGGTNGEAPVHTSSASNCTSMSWSSTHVRRVSADMTTPWPGSTRTFMPSMRSRTPRLWCSATARARASVRRRLTSGKPRAKSTPSSSAWLIFSIASAVVSSVLDGIASVIVQLPPSWLSSIRVTSAPRWAAVAAAAYPAGPPPRMASRMPIIVDCRHRRHSCHLRRHRDPGTVPVAAARANLPGRPRRHPGARLRDRGRVQLLPAQPTPTWAARSRHRRPRTRCCPARAPTWRRCWAAMPARSCSAPT